ncbi:hypothetical protein Pyn_00569 [Prunus yedoensis var. nudiflora]|uniref:Uncharacterized protein n=1 Tax=Prunus yedoensis var. nudiflora TaxID=2094558 RepID=A0A314UCM6_PRUYE|nr:hypothetical protein Pyn_00569 [Prunus yedoensis var. nudiflora]
MIVAVEVEVGVLVPVLEASGCGGYGSGVGEKGGDSEVGLDGGYESVFIDIGKRDRGREKEKEEVMGGDEKTNPTALKTLTKYLNHNVINHEEEVFQ